MNEMQKLGQLIREARERNGLEAQSLAAAMGVSKGMISNIERGVLKNTPDADLLRSLSRHTGVPVEKMLQTLGYLDTDASPESEAVSAVRAILGDRNFTDKDIHYIVEQLKLTLSVLSR